VFSFSSDAEPDDDDKDDDASLLLAAASFAWRISSVPDIDIGRRAPVPVVVGGDLAPGRPSVEDVDDTRV